MASTTPTIDTQDRSKSQQSIIALLQSGPKDLRELILESTSRIPIAHTAVNDLEREGIIEQVGGEKRGEEPRYGLVER